MATFALIHGGGSSAWDWHLVVPELRERGHEAVAVDLPSEDASAGWWAYADAVAGAVDGRHYVVVVAHSLGGFTTYELVYNSACRDKRIKAAVRNAPGWSE